MDKDAMDAIDVEDGSEQLPDIELLACALFKLIDDKADGCLIGAEKIELSISDVALLLCDLTKADRLKIIPTPATVYYMGLLKSDMAMFRASRMEGA